MSAVGGAALKTAAAPMHAPAQPLGVDQNRMSLSLLVAMAAVAVLGFNPPLVAGISAGALAVLALLPVWLPAIKSFQYAKFLLWLSVAAVAWGGLIVVFSDRPFSGRLAFDVILILITGLGGLGLLLWARTLMPTWQVALIFGLGYLAHMAMAVGASNNPWKYQLSIPITIIGLALASRAKSAAPTVLVLLAIGAVSIATNSRSFFGFCILAIVIFLWQRRPATEGRKMNKGLVLVMIGVVLAALYTVGTSLLTEGYLGEDAQQRTVKQIEESGSLLAGGRPEWFGTFQLMQNTPMGFGPGTLPIGEDVLAAKVGMHSVGVPTNTGYIENYMFADRIELHSVIADLWASFGIVGFALGISMVVVLLLALLGRLSLRNASGLVVMFSIVAIWDLFFGPIYSNLPDIMLALAVAIPFAAGAVTVTGEVRDD